jgi:ATP-dependent DNA helicase RecQ
MPEKSGEGVDKSLFEFLREKRLELARRRSKPAYVIFNDKTLRELARRAPRTLEAFSVVEGVGAKKLREFGETFIGYIREYGGERVESAPSSATPHSGAASPKKQDLVELKAVEHFEAGGLPADLAQTAHISRYRAMKLFEEFLIEQCVWDASPWLGQDWDRIREAVEALNERQRTTTISRYLDGSVDDESIEIALICLRNADRR